MHLIMGNGQMSPLLFQFLGANTPGGTNDAYGMLLLKQALDDSAQEQKAQDVARLGANSNFSNYQSLKNQYQFSPYQMLFQLAQMQQNDPSLKNLPTPRLMPQMTRSNTGIMPGGQKR